MAQLRQRTCAPPTPASTTHVPLPLEHAPLVSRRTLALSLLVVQNASVALLTRWSRLPSSSTSSSSALYNPAAAVFTAELLKAAVSLFCLAAQRSAKTRRGVVREARDAVGELKGQRGECARLAVPAGLYALQNTLLYTALSNLDAATYQTTYQLKLLTTALFSLLFFRRRLSAQKWLALVLLTAGVAIVQLPSSSSASSSSSCSTASERKVAAASRGGGAGQDPAKGFAAILAACVSSGLAGGWFEYVLKASPSPGPSSTATTTSPSPAPVPAPPSLWARNLQLSVPSLAFSLLGLALSAPVRAVAAREGWAAAVSPAQVWRGFGGLTWAVVGNQAGGGLLVAMVVREADSVAKGFATSLAIVLSTLLSSLLTRTLPGALFCTGAALVVGSTVLYSLDRDRDGGASGASAGGFLALSSLETL
ncbi:hypothetical protein JCM10207_003166 [Rhodosporidiobolus poonsookiae]